MLRVVFDSAAKTDEVSLNELLEKEPNILKNLPEWCSLFAVGVAGEITKMFLRILLHP